MDRRQLPTDNSVTFDSVFLGQGIVLPDSRLKFLDTRSKSAASSSCDKLSTYLHRFANEPSTALYRIREHVHSKVPVLVERARFLRRKEKRVEKALFDVKYALIASKGVYNARRSVRKITNLLNYNLFGREPEQLHDSDLDDLSDGDLLPDDRDLLLETNGSDGLSDDDDFGGEFRIKSFADDTSPGPKSAAAKRGGTRLEFDGVGAESPSTPREELSDGDEPGGTTLVDLDLNDPFGLGMTDDDDGLVLSSRSGRKSKTRGRRSRREKKKNSSDAIADQDDFSLATFDDPTSPPLPPTAPPELITGDVRDPTPAAAEVDEFGMDLGMAFPLDYFDEEPDVGVGAKRGSIRSKKRGNRRSKKRRVAFDDDEDDFAALAFE